MTVEGRQRELLDGRRREDGTGRLDGRRAARMGEGG